MAKYASKIQTDRLEIEIENLRCAVSKQAELIVEMRELLLPVPIDVVLRERNIGGAGSPVVRNGQFHG